MAIHNEIGRNGEDKAVEYLKNKGFRIIERNWFYRQKEIDIIAMDKDTLVFIEVKTRSYDIFGNPIDAINREKQKYIIEAANAYIEKNNIENEVRFDIVTVMLKKTGTEIEYIADAFYPRVKRF
jgi:putative endonuclease